jgi:hypothetical protein
MTLWLTIEDQWRRVPDLGRWTGMPVRGMICICLAVLLLAGCGEKKKTNKNLAFVKDATETLTGIKLDEVEQIRSDVIRLKESLERRDWEALKQACAELDKRYNQRILTWYAEVLLIEQTRGTDAAQEAVARLKAQDKLSEKEVRALGDIESYFMDTLFLHDGNS